MGSLDDLQAALAATLGTRMRSSAADRGELTIEVTSADAVDALTALRDEPKLAFSTMIDLIGVDYRGYPGHDGPRFEVVYNLLSLVHNWRVRVRVACPDDDFPALESAINVWPSAN